MSYKDIYKKRVNRFGDNEASRLEEGRRINFERFLKSSPHYVKFNYKGSEVECVFEPQLQNETKEVMHILCRVGQHFNIGDIVEIVGKEYMFWYWDERRDSGYNRYCVIRVNQVLTQIFEDEIIGEEGERHFRTREIKAYLYGQEDNMLKNELKSRSRSATLYLENLKLDFIMIPTDPEIKIGSYLEIVVDGIERDYRVTGFDPVSTPGIMYVSMDVTPKHDLTLPPEYHEETDDPNDFFWLGKVTDNG